MKTNKKTLKTLVFSLGLATMMLSATNLNAQDRPGGLFSTNPSKDASRSVLMRDGTRANPTINDTTGSGINNDDFGAPLGSGIAIMVVAGLGYVALKKKED